jgi:lipid II:glycine glycyltransferase (peptidoglycan interpeptide bridge formation enzyme)
MPIYTINPLSDARWDSFVSRHPEASAFHSRAWLEALRQTYGYESVAYTTTAPGKELTDAMVFCKVRSWLTGKRLVSLPFSDHCQPLVDNPAAFSTLITHLKESVPRERWEYCELRPFSSAGLAANNTELGLRKSSSYYIHVLDLRPDLDTLFHKFHKSCVQRKIARAERERLVYEEGHSDEQLRKFYCLLLMTRRRHGLPPQPLLWFENLIRSFGDHATVHLASKDGQPLASIFTIWHKNSLVYKYGCSDARFHNLGGVAMLHWHAIQAAKERGLGQYDLGRSELDNHGLISFKSNWAAQTYSVDYFRYSAQNGVRHGSLRREKAVEAVFSRMPDSLLMAAGKLLYRHIG